MRNKQKAVTLSRDLLSSGKRQEGQYQDKKTRLPNPQEATNSNDNIMACQTEKIRKSNKELCQKKMVKMEDKQ